MGFFAAGFWRCLSCLHAPTDDLIAARASGDRDNVAAATAKFLLDACQRTPLETMALAFLKYELALDAARLAVDAYEDFLVILDSELDRTELSDLDAPNAETSVVFGRAKEAARRFQDGLSKLFFATDDNLTKDAQSFGVF